MRASSVRRLVVLAALVPGCYAKCIASKPPVSPTHSGVGPALVVRLPPPESLGSISGRVLFKGTPPSRAVIEMSDPACVCAETPLEESVEVGEGGGLKNVMVWVSKGLDPAYVWPEPGAAAALTQSGCRYTPHVLSMQARQSLRVWNADEVSHNVHTHPKQNTEDNWSQGAKQVDLLTLDSRHRTFSKAEDPFRVGCEIHGWMNAWVGVFRHPFHAVTGMDGTFRLAGVPEGKLTLRFWHEKLGTQDVEVDVKRGADTGADSEFHAP